MIQPSPGGRHAMVGKEPVLIRLSWFVLAYHRRRACWTCRPDGCCPRVELARRRIRAWLRFGSNRGGAGNRRGSW
ncbi:hypothetical protein [Micromonospora sp. SH-82]|uniref:hypothetical protein n=1 Tax=Micromonospora sp. SH-82 TaxID=3132938 RepID=UPI003EBA4254